MVPILEPVLLVGVPSSSSGPAPVDVGRLTWSKALEGTSWPLVAPGTAAGPLSRVRLLQPLPSSEARGTPLSLLRYCPQAASSASLYFPILREVGTGPPRLWNPGREQQVLVSDPKAEACSSAPPQGPIQEQRRLPAEGLPGLALPAQHLRHRHPARGTVRAKRLCSWRLRFKSCPD